MNQRLPDGLSEEQILEIIAHYDSLSEEEAVAEDEVAFWGEDVVNVAIPKGLLPQVLLLLQSYEPEPAKKKVKRK